MNGDKRKASAATARTRSRRNATAGGTSTASTAENLVLRSNESSGRFDGMVAGMEQFLRHFVGSDWHLDPNFRDTPRRVAKMFLEMTRPQHNNWMTFPAGSTDLIVLRNHKVVGICPHHLMPVEMKCFIGYIPHRETLGLSKLARVVEQQLTAPLMQEDLAHKVANSLEKALDPKGVAVVISGVHGCMRFRGVESEGDVVTSVMKGALFNNPAARAEFFSLIGRP